MIDVYLSDVRDEAAARAFFEQAKNTTGITPEQITTDKEAALYPAIKNVFGDKVKHRDSRYMNNLVEQDHRAIKSRVRIMKGFKNIFSALKFCTIYEEIREVFRARNNTRAERRKILLSKITKLNDFATATA